MSSNLKKYKLQKQYRFKDYDYSQNGFYFVTICTENRRMFFGNIEWWTPEYPAPRMQLSKLGEIVEKYWQEIPNHFNNVQLDEFIIMPNHIHGIILINIRNEAVPRSYGGKYPQMSKISPLSKSLSSIVGSFKSVVTKNINLQFPELRFSWQSRFHDRIIRNWQELEKIRKYIIENPDNWKDDRNNLNNCCRNEALPRSYQCAFSSAAVSDPLRLSFSKASRDCGGVSGLLICCN